MTTLNPCVSDSCSRIFPNLYNSPDPDVTHDTLVSQVSVSVQEAPLDQVSVFPTLGDDLLLQCDVLCGAEHEHQPRDQPRHLRPAPGASNNVTIFLGVCFHVYKNIFHLYTLEPCFQERC